MAHKQVRAQASDNTGNQITIDAHESDCPILPVAHIERLQQVRPDIVDFIVEETKKEAAHRRSRNDRVNWFIFIERMFGQLCALIVGIVGVGGGVYLGVKGQPWLGGTIATAMIGTLAVAYLRRDKSKSANGADKSAPAKGQAARRRSK